MHYEYLIVGAGLFGAVFAHEMTKEGKKCLVVEKRDHIAGNIYCETVDDIHVHKYGAHIFHTSNKKVWDYINTFAEFNNYINSPVASYKDELYNLPFNMNTFSKMWGIKTPQEAKDIIAKQIKELDLSLTPSLDFARDMFLFSFCTRGMSFVDMAYLKKKDLKNGYLTYRRKKTGQLLTVEWTRQMQDIIDKYPINPTHYLLPLILREDGSERRQYQNQMMKINRHLKDIASLIKLPVSLSLYYSRHSWATIARGKDIPLSVISEALGHDSEITTQIYLDSIKSVEVDKANRKILKDL